MYCESCRRPRWDLQDGTNTFCLFPSSNDCISFKETRPGYKHPDPINSAIEDPIRLDQEETAQLIKRLLVQEIAALYKAERSWAVQSRFQGSQIWDQFRTSRLQLGVLAEYWRNLQIPESERDAILTSINKELDALDRSDAISKIEPNSPPLATIVKRGRISRLIRRLFRR